jgi:glycosyltransferase involved in cell wall biosynthesis
MKDPAALCRALEDLLAEPEKAIAMGIKGRQKAKQFTLAAYIDQYEALYGEL